MRKTQSRVNPTQTMGGFADVMAPGAYFDSQSMKGGEGKNDSTKQWLLTTGMAHHITIAHV
jgi:hypothetical protein